MPLAMRYAARLPSLRSLALLSLDIPIIARYNYIARYLISRSPGAIPLIMRYIERLMHCRSHCAM